MKAHSEAAFEELIEQHLLEHGGYVSREPGVFVAESALIPEDLLAFVERTQPGVWDKQGRIHGDRLPEVFLAAFDKATQQDGVLHVLRHGFKFYGSRVRVAAFQPAHGLNPDVEELYRANRLAVARQVHYDPKRPGLSLDLVLFLNGIPLVTAELKNALTQQTARHAKAQYVGDRDPGAPIFRFGERALVHFAVGADEVWMTTRLAGDKTRFLPFNRGNGTAAGNPAVEGKHRTFYLWEEVWQRDSLLDLFARFLHVEKTETTDERGRTSTRETLIFPRYHQLDCVRRLIAATRERG
ncbi:MAG: type I restriction endonuclease subunit R, partial [Acidobacteria bacterium]|nr:type I restriction endonuclease subunit R [Acidobacteriota bacterium]